MPLTHIKKQLNTRGPGDGLGDFLDPFGIISNPAHREDAKAKKALDDALASWNIPLPELGEINPDEYQWLADLQMSQMDPRLGQAGPSAMGGVATDPRLAQDQQAALSALQELSSGGGFNATDRANMARMQGEVATADKGRRDAIMQNMQARGQSGSGNDLLAQLQSSQAATDRAAQQGLDIQGMGQDRALNAMMQQGSLATNLRQQDFGEQSQKAQASDAINRFNAQNAMNAGQYNTQQKNLANQQNWAGKQGMSNKNTDMRNQSQEWNQVGRQQQNFQNQSSLAAGKSGAHKDMGQYWDTQGTRKTDKLGRLGNAAIKMGAGAMGGS